MNIMAKALGQDEEQNEESLFGFERLRVWQAATDFANLVYDVTSEFPKQEQFGLAVQMRRAAISVAANIAEGNSRFSKSEQARFMEIAYGSLMELLAESTVAEQQKFLSTSQYEQMRLETRKIANMLTNFRHALLQKK